jgi:MFS transporter, PPP family, 3-phenylpropionic acid transporter
MIRLSSPGGGLTRCRGQQVGLIKKSIRVGPDWLFVVWVTAGLLHRPVAWGGHWEVTKSIVTQSIVTSHVALSQIDRPQSDPPQRHRPSPWFAWRLGLYFGTLFLIYGVHVTYYPVWLYSRGLKPEEIGLITALPIFVRTVLTPAISAYADARGNHRSVIIALSILSVVLTLAISQSTSFMALFWTSIPFSIAIGSIMPLTETIAVEGVRAAGHDYGRMRLWGSLTFLLSTLLAGLLSDAYGANIGIWVVVAVCAFNASAALLLPRVAVSARKAEPLPLGPPVGGGTLAWRLGRLPVFVAFLIAVGSIHGAHSAFYVFGALHLKGQGVSGGMFGILWAISVFAEMALFAYSTAIVTRIEPTKLLIAAGIASVIRWGAMSLDPPLAVIAVLQVLHALTYGAGHLAAIHFIARAVPKTGAGTAQGLYSAVGSGLITGLATLLAGHLYPTWAGQTFLAMGAMSALGLASAVWLHKTWNRSPILREPPQVSPRVPAAVVR